LAVLKMLD